MPGVFGLAALGLLGCDHLPGIAGSDLSAGPEATERDPLPPSSTTAEKGTGPAEAGSRATRKLGDAAPGDDSSAVLPQSDPSALPETSKPVEPPAPHPGPWLWVRRSSAGIFEQPTTSRAGKLGYVKRGGKVAIFEEKIDAPGCPGGWYRVVSGGVICGQVGTTDPQSPAARFPARQPDTSAILPYPYARNAHNGTPLYKSLPSRAQMFEYEPYLPEAKQAQEAAAAETSRESLPERDASTPPGALGALAGDPARVGEGSVLGRAKEGLSRAGPEAPEQGSEPPPGDRPSSTDEPLEESLGFAESEADAAEEAEIPLWEREENLHEVTLDDLRKDADDILAQRMMKGFYVAIDKTFKWNGRTWYKTTKGLVAPADRLAQTAGSDFHGVEIDGETWQLPIGFVVGARKSAPTYAIDDATGHRTPVGSLEKFAPVPLQYSYKKVGDVEYYQMRDGNWIRDAHTRVTTPGPRPEEVGPDEVWIDVDISEQTLVVFRGDAPIYATLLSSGKESKVKEKDHSTPRGKWRVREKHMVSTMDGNGTAAGDLPYSIEDVPYIMYFHKSYATHGAFWHQNYGFQMSHGCVNLAPLDAKWVFFHAAPLLSEDMHGAWSTDTRPGSMIVIHD